MTDIIFARTAHNYDSYSDFWRLVELSGFPIVQIGDIPREGWRDKAVIATPANGEWMNGIQTDARVIHWQLEWQTDPENGSPPGVAEVWASDPSFANFIGAKYVMLGSHRKLNLEYDLPIPDKLFDVVMLQYLTPRRQRIRHELQQAGVSIAPDGWGDTRHFSLHRSRLMLHVHQHENIKTIAPLRWAIAAAYKLPVVSETVERTGIPDCSVVPYEDLVSYIKGYARESITVQWGEWLYHSLCIEHTFRREVEAAV